MKTLLWLLLTTSLLRGAIPPPCQYDFEAQRWVGQIVANGGTLSSSSYRAGTVFMLSVKRWGVRQYLGRVGLYIGDNTNAMLVPIIRDFFTTSDNVDDLVAFVSTDYSEATGLTGNALTKYLRLNGSVGLNLSGNTGSSDTHMAVYIRTASNQAGYCAGVSYGASGSEGMGISYLGTSYLQCGNNTVSTADANGKGLYITSRTATNLAVMYRDAATVQTDSGNDAGANGGGIFVVHAFNNAGAITAWTDRALSYYAVGKGVPANRIVAYTIAVLNVQLALNRKV